MTECCDKGDEWIYELGTNRGEYIIYFADGVEEARTMRVYFCPFCGKELEK